MRRFNTSSFTRRGNAEIELIIAAPLLMLLLVLAVATLRLHSARQRAAADAFTGVMEAANSTSLFPLDSFSTLRPERLRLRDVPSGIPAITHFPNRTVHHRRTEEARMLPGRLGHFSQGTFVDSAALIAPPWTLGSGLPTPDARGVQSWQRQMIDYALAGYDRSLRLPRSGSADGY